MFLYLVFFGLLLGCAASDKKDAEKPASEDGEEETEEATDDETDTSTDTEELLALELRTEFGDPAELEVRTNGIFAIWWYPQFDHAADAEVMFEQDAKIRALPPVTPTLARMIEDAVEPAQLVPDCSERIVATMRKVQEQAPPNCIAQDKWEEQEQTSQCTQAASRMFLPRREGQDENASAALVGSMTWLATRSTRAAYRLAHTSRASAS